MKTGFENSLLDSGQIMKRGYSMLAQNVGKTIALITGIVATLVTFTEIGFCDFGAESFTSTVILMLIASYIIYFSLEDAGEKLGKETEEYQKCEEQYKKERNKLYDTDIGRLRDFCYRYAGEELIYRRKNTLLSYGFSYSDYERFLAGEEFKGRARRVFRRVKRMKPIPLTPRQLLTKERSPSKSELINPEYGKPVRLFLKLIPSTVCMLFTVSVMLSARDGMTPEFILESILKLSTLPIIGLRGYSQGYFYAKSELTLWVQTKTRMIGAFIKQECTTSV